MRISKTIGSNEFYFRLHAKVRSGEFSLGNSNARLDTINLEGKSLADYSYEQITPEIYASLMKDGKCLFKDVPYEKRTKEFFITAFSNPDVYSYIQNHSNEFDRDFFKDLICSNKYSVILPRNCFKIMPLEYIDEEMCTLAILTALDFSDSNWFYDVVKRKPNVLTSDMWHLAARLYSGVDKNGFNAFLAVTPEEEKDGLYYREMCSYPLNCDMSCTGAKGKMTDFVPDEYLTPMFVFDILFSGLNNIQFFGEKALEIEVTYPTWCRVVTQKAWQLAIEKNGELISFIPLNDERVDFFLANYAKDSSEYKNYFKPLYKEYLAKKNDPEGYQRRRQRIENIRKSLACSTLILTEVGGNPDETMDLIEDGTKIDSISYLPFAYAGKVPLEYAKTHDSEEYLALVYKALGIEVIEEYDDLFYQVKVPDSWILIRYNNDYTLYDEEGNAILTYYYYGKITDREAYVKDIHVDIDLTPSDSRKRKYRPKKED